VTDPTTQGYEADPDEVEALLNDALGDITEEPDPVIRYTMLSKLLVLHDVVVGRIASERARAVAAMHTPGGMSYAQIGEAIGVSRSRAQQLVVRGRALCAPTTATEWADALDAEMSRTGQSAGDLISQGYAKGHILGVVLEPEHPEADDERAVIVSEQGWVVRYNAQAGYWTAD
jgi:hypothetical protein